MRTAEGLLSEAMDSAYAGGDPYPALTELSSRYDAVRAPSGITYVCGYDATATFLRSSALGKHGEHGSAAFAGARERPGVDRPARCPVAHAPETGWLTTIDDPDHGRLRELVARPFMKREIDRLQPVVLDRLHGLLAGIDQSAPVDLVKEIGFRLPTMMVDAIVGTNLASSQTFPWLAHEHQRDREPHANAEDRAAAKAAREEIFALIDDAFADDIPRDSVAALLLRAEKSHTATRREITTLVGQMYLAGFHGPAYMLSNGTRALIDHPDQYRLLHSRPRLAADCVEEVLRFDTPLMTATYRANRATVIGGMECAEGAPITFLLGAANHDNRVFPEPNRFNILRPRSAPVMSFSTGPHYCLAASLSRLIGEVTLRELAHRFPRMTYAAGPPEHAATFQLRGHPRMEVVLEPEASVRAVAV